MKYQRGSYLKFGVPAGQATQITLSCYWRRFSARTFIRAETSGAAAYGCVVVSRVHSTVVSSST
jgi:hypothetical protein